MIRNKRFTNLQARAMAMAMGDHKTHKTQAGAS
jgi:hypothetical protein